ncbi:MAG: ThiF family adenylyltransferase [Candidatus Helarchaeota archaeon]
MEKKEKKVYQRHFMLKGWAQELIKDSSVFMIGVGALGCEIAKNLALVGIGRMVLVDVDTIETSNLSRQMLFKPGDEGRPKAEVAAERLKELNPFLKVETYFKFLQEIPLSVYESCDVIIGGLDNIKARLDLNDICLRLKKPLIDSGTLGFEGHVQIVIPDGIPGMESTPCLRCVMPVPPTDEKMVAACTPKGIPQKREHCALKAEYDFGKEFNRRPDFDNDEDVRFLTERANKYVKEHNFPPEFRFEDMENVIKNKMPAIQTTTAVISAVQSHEVLKLLHLLKGENIGPIIKPPYINYNGVYGLFEYIDIAKWEECPACGHGTDIRTIEVSRNENISMLFDGVMSAYEGLEVDIDQSLVTKELTKTPIWNPYLPSHEEDKRKTMGELIGHMDILILTRPKQDPVRVLVKFID